MMFGGTQKYVSGTLAGLIALLPIYALAQDQGGLNASLSMSQGITTSQDDGTFARGDIGFDLTSVTRTQNFAFSMGGAVEFLADDDISFEDPQATLSYGLENRTTALTTRLSFRQADADAIVQDDSGPLPVLALDSGRREDRNFTFNYVFGREEPFGGNITYSYSDTDYTGTTSAEFVDIVSERLSVGLRFEIDPRITATLNYAVRETDRDGGRDVRTETLRLGTELAVTQTLSANIGIGLTEVTEDDSTGRTVEEGVDYQLSLSQDRPNGAITGRFSSDITETGRRSTFTISRAFDLPRGSLQGRLGVTEGSDLDLQPTYGLTYKEDLPRGSYDIAFDQSFATTAAGDEVLNSRLRANWQQQLTRTDRFDTNVGYRLQDATGSASDESRFDFGINYTHDLSPDWAVVTRYSHSVSDITAGTTDRDNTLYLGIQTNLGWRP